MAKPGQLSKKADEDKKRKEKNTPLGVIQEKLMVKPSFPLA